jgi:serine/threonine protein kinase
MEFLEGQTLADELRIGGRFSEDAVIEVARAVCGALAAVHAAGLLHHVQLTLGARITVPLKAPPRD